MKKTITKKTFLPSERMAVWIIHGPKCYLCGKPLNYCSFTIDHVLPESLLTDIQKRSRTFQSLDVAEDFEINSYENWLPACTDCNVKKANASFRAAPIFLRYLERAKKSANDARTLATQIGGDTKITKSILQIENAIAAKTVTVEALMPLLSLVQHYVENAELTRDVGQALRSDAVGGFLFPLSEDLVLRFDVDWRIQ